MLKKALFSMALLGMWVAPLLAQSNVEKAVRFRATAKTSEVFQRDASARIEPRKDAPCIPVPLKGSSAQLENLGGFIWSNSDSQLENLGGYIWNDDSGQLEDLGGFAWNNGGSQLKDLGGYIWANSGTQLKDLGCSYCSRGHIFSVGQLDDLGNRYAVAWTNGDSQLNELGGYIWSYSDSQLKDLGPTVRPRFFSAGQLDDLGGYIWSYSGSQLKDQ